jgi:8-oxo-dGTP pyrophosphatase MutT (NUDIX family)
MESKTQLIEMIEQYRKHFPGEKDRTIDILRFTEAFDGRALFDRKNFTGHITASAYILNNARDSLLLLKHKFLNRWLQPGGHVEYSDSSLIHAALREAEEETGITTSNLIIVEALIFDIDSHAIPANTAKMEPSHVHHDASFLFTCNIPYLIKIDHAESTAGKWISLSELSRDKSYGRILKKIQ